MGALAWLYYQQGRYDEAEPLILEGLDIQRRLLGEEHRSTANTIKNLIEFYEAWGKPEKAKEWRAKLPRKESTEEQQP